MDSVIKYVLPVSLSHFLQCAAHDHLQKELPISQFSLDGKNN